MKRALVVCARRYNGHELWTALGVMRQQGLEFEVSSTGYTIEDELTARPNTIKRTLDDIGPEYMDEFDGFMVVSGNMSDTEAYWKDKRILRLIDRANESEKPIAAICCSVPTIRYAAKGKKVSFFPLIRSRILLQDAGAILQSVAVTVDDKLVTAEHQMASTMWAEAFSNVMNELPHGVNLVDSKYMPKGRLRKPIQALEKIKAGGPVKDWYVTPHVDERDIVTIAKPGSRVHFHLSGQDCTDMCYQIEP